MEVGDLDLARQGDLKALGRVIVEARPLALAAARRCARRAGRPDLTEDLVAAAIGGSAKGVGGLILAVRMYEPDLGAWAPFAYNMAARGARSELRFLVRLSKRSDELDEGNEPAIGSEDAVIALIDSKNMFPRCSRRERQVVRRAASGAEAVDIAVELGLTPSCIRSQLAKARARLRA